MSSKNRGLVVLLLGFALLLSACSSYRKKADNLLEEGQFKAALDMYQKALDQDPNDEKAIAGRNRARLGYIDHFLIQARMTRLGGDSLGSTNILREVILNQREWRLFPTGAVAFTQQEEMRYSSIYLKKEVSHSLQLKQPLRTSYLLSYYEPVFDSEQAQFRSEADRQAREQGQQVCRDKVRVSNLKGKPYLTDFLRKFCSYYGVRSPLLAKNTAGERGLYKHLKVQPKGSWSHTFLQSLRGSLAKEFRLSAWFDAQGPQAARMVLTGSYKYTQDRSPTYLSHSYQKKIPIKKTLSDGRKVETGEYRMESRLHRYLAYNESQFFNVSLNAITKLKNSPLELPYSSSDQRSGITHDQYLPDIGLYPAKSRLVPEMTYIQKAVEEVSSKFSDSLKNSWVQMYCQGTSSTEFDGEGNEVWRCLREQRVTPPLFADNWHKTHFAVVSKEAQFVLGHL